MRKKVVTENADIEVLANGEAISMTFTDTEYEDNTVGSWLNAEQAADLADALIDAIEICYPKYMEAVAIGKEDE